MRLAVELEGLEGELPLACAVLIARKGGIWACSALACAGACGVAIGCDVFGALLAAECAGRGEGAAGADTESEALCAAKGCFGAPALAMGTLPSEPGAAACVFGIGGGTLPDLGAPLGARGESEAIRPP